MNDPEITITTVGTYQQNTLPCHPPYRQYRPALYPVVVLSVQTATHAEVRDLDSEVMTHQTVAGREVTVDHIEGLEVLHARGDLTRHVDESSVAVGGRRQTCK